MKKTTLSLFCVIAIASLIMPFAFGNIGDIKNEPPAKTMHQKKETVRAKPHKPDMVRYKFYNRYCYFRPQAFNENVYKSGNMYFLMEKEQEAKVELHKGEAAKRYKQSIAWLQGKLKNSLIQKFRMYTKKETVGYFYTYSIRVGKKPRYHFYTELENGDILDLCYIRANSSAKHSFNCGMGTELLQNFINPEFTRKSFQITPDSNYEKSEYKEVRIEAVK